MMAFGKALAWIGGSNKGIKQNIGKIWPNEAYYNNKLWQQQKTSSPASETSSTKWSYMLTLRMEQIYLDCLRWLAPLLPHPYQWSQVISQKKLGPPACSLALKYQKTLRGVKWSPFWRLQASLPSKRWVLRNTNCLLSNSYRRRSAKRTGKKQPFWWSSSTKWRTTMHKKTIGWLR